MKKKKVLAISGSTRLQSTNQYLINALINLSAGELDIQVFNGLEQLPQFNPDKDNEQVPDTVRRFRYLISNAEGIIICTPEYAHGVPGALKNAIDWTISTGEFPNKPTMLITAATDGRFGHRALLDTMRAVEAKNIDNLQLVIQFAKTKIIKNQITDEKTLHEVEKLLAEFYKTIDETKAISSS
jgi:NAD(P)H-dependent FMN reductase